METVFHGLAGELHIGGPELYVDNHSRRRSGHMSHAMAEYAPGRIICFNSNCSPARCGGHSAFGWIEYRTSADGGRTWSAPRDLPYSRNEFFDGVHTISVEKAVAVDGVITIFALRNSQFEEICCEAWDTIMTLQSRDGGETWNEPRELGAWRGRLYDAVVRDGVIYAMMFCNEHFVGKKPEHVYRLYRSIDRGASFEEVSVVGLAHRGSGYGALQFRPDGSLLAYACRIGNEYLVPVSISHDLGKTWRRLPAIRLKHGIRNIQIARLSGGYVMHGRAFQGVPCGKGFVFYTSRDGLKWDDGILLETEKRLCYYSNNLVLKDPDGAERMLVQYSDVYEGRKVDVMHRWVTLR